MAEWTWPDGYDPSGTECSSGPQPGLVALQGWLDDNRYRGHSGGIYNCRPVRGGTSLSLHGEGRALDWMTSGADGDQVLDLLATRGRQLGIQFIIWNRRKYGPRYPAGAPYSGASPHTDHLHIEMTWAAARNLNRETVDAIMEEDMPLTDEDLDRIADKVVERLLAARIGGYDPFDGRDSAPSKLDEVLHRLHVRASKQKAEHDQIVDKLD